MTATADLPDIQATDKEELAPAPEAPENFANREDVRTNVLGVVKDVMARRSAYMFPLWKRWRLTDYMLAGNTIDRAGPMEVHVPELYKMVETIVPRAMDALLDRDPWFRLNPKTEADEPFAEAMAALQDHQTRQAKFKERAEQAFRNLLITQSCAFLVDWKDERMDVVRPLRDANGKITKTIKKTVKKYVGPTARLIDPFDFIIDPRCTDEQDAMYVGHRCMMTVAEMKQLAFLRDEKGELTSYAKESLDRLEKQSPSDWGRSLGGQSDPFKLERSPTERLEGNYRSPAAPVSRKSPPQFEVIQLAMPLNLLDDGVFEESIIIVAGGTEVLLACKNPYLWKHRPYITARAAKNAHNFYGVGPLDNAVRLNQMLDRYHAIFQRMAEVTASPFWWVENEGADIPTSLYHSRPGRVVAGAGKVTPMALPGEALRNGPMVIGMISRNIQETVGAFDIQMGQTSGEVTATSDLTALQEGNRRLKGLFTNFAGIANKWLSMGWKLNAQYMTEPDTFEVIGKRSKDLNARMLTVGPDIFINEPYYQIVGVEGLNTYGMRATALAQATQIMLPMLMPHAGTSFNDLELAHEYFANVTDNVTADRIIKVRQSRDQLWSQEEENHKLLAGKFVPVSPDDPHELHVQKMQPLLTEYRKKIDAGKKFDFTVWAALAQHANQHLVAMQRQEEEKAMQAQLRPPAPPPQLGGQQSPDGQGASPQLGGLPAQMTNPQGESPGPMGNRLVGKFGRNASPLSQTQAQPA